LKIVIRILHREEYLFVKEKKIEKTSRELQLIQKHGAEEHKRLKLVQEQVANRKEVISVIGKEMEVLQGQIDSLGGRIAHLRNR